MSSHRPGILKFSCISKRLSVTLIYSRSRAGGLVRLPGSVGARPEGQSGAGLPDAWSEHGLRLGRHREIRIYLNCHSERQLASGCAYRSTQLTEYKHFSPFLILRVHPTGPVCSPERTISIYLLLSKFELGRRPIPSRQES